MQLRTSISWYAAYKLVSKANEGYPGYSPVATCKPKKKQGIGAEFPNMPPYRVSVLYKAVYWNYYRSYMKSLKYFVKKAVEGGGRSFEEQFTYTV
ncbi:hypothetical protein RB195_020381 [Necator americanus]|uniref:Uncharacterized protein n=1 Tax=Necator americanus TaxID=51031 RepID=A0ABR1CIK2_NECAM